MAEAIIIGAGIGGLATAVRLACQGHQVTVLEAAAGPGGKLSQFVLEAEGQGTYRFDAGPSLFTMPQRVEELFQLAGVEMAPYFQHQRLADVCHYFYPNGKQLTAWADPTKLAAELEDKLGEPAANTIAYLKAAAHKYDVVGDLFLHRSLHKLSTWTSPAALKAYPQMPWLGLMSTMDEVNQKAFRTAEARQLFNRYATYNGSDPYQTPGLLTLIPHLEANLGAYFPTKGMYSITEAVYQLAIKLGVKFQFNTPVQEILHSDKLVTGVKIAGGETLAADIVVSNLDVHPTYHRLLPHLPKPERVLRQQRSSSALIFYWGIAQSFPELGLHNILFSADYRTEFKHLFEWGTISDDPTLYINISSKLKPDDAPAGQENWFMMINVPNNTTAEGGTQDWDQMIKTARQHIIQKVNKMLGVDIAPLITTEHILEPRSIEQLTGSYQGSLYGNSSNNRWAAFLRHNNRHPKVKGLYFVGGSVHPGGGIPLALSSAQIVADLVSEQS